MSAQRTILKYPIVWTSNLSQPIFVGDFRHIEITAVGTGNIQVLATKDFNPSAGNPSGEPVDFSAPSTIGNSYAPIVIADETVANSYVTTLAVAGTKIGEVNTNFVGWISVSRSIDTVDAFITVADNI